MQQLTKKQSIVLKFICNFFQTHNFCPTYQEIATHFNFSSVATVRTYLEHLETKGFIQRHKKARALTIKHNPFSTPIIGTIQAGLPIEAIENIESTLTDIPALQQSPSKFGLKVKGDSMINAGIIEGDIAIIDTKEAIISEQIVAAKIDNEVTLKIYKKSPTNITLIAANPNYQAIHLLNQQVTLLGRCIGIIRNYKK